jgi:hypothetical protein
MIMIPDYSIFKKGFAFFRNWSDLTIGVGIEEIHERGDIEICKIRLDHQVSQQDLLISVLGAMRVEVHVPHLMNLNAFDEMVRDSFWVQPKDRLVILIGAKACWATNYTAMSGILEIFVDAHMSRRERQAGLYVAFVD